MVAMMNQWDPDHDYIHNHPVALYLEEHHRAPYWSQAMGVIGVLEEMGCISNDPYGPPPKDRDPVVVKFNIGKIAALIRKWLRKKEERCGKRR